MIVKIINIKRLTSTTLAPAAVDKKYEHTIPITKLTTATIDEHTITEKNLLHTLIEVSAGKIIKLEISNVPIIFIPITTVSAVSTAITRLYLFALVPVAFAKFHQM